MLVTMCYFLERFTEKRQSSKTWLVYRTENEKEDKQKMEGHCFAKGDLTWGFRPLEKPAALQSWHPGSRMSLRHSTTEINLRTLPTSLFPYKSLPFPQALKQSLLNRGTNIGMNQLIRSGRNCD